MKNWKTTTLGVFTILLAVSTAAVEFLKNGSCDFMSLSANVAIGLALIKAADAK